MFSLPPSLKIALPGNAQAIRTSADQLAQATTTLRSAIPADPTVAADPTLLWNAARGVRASIESVAPLADHQIVLRSLQHQSEDLGTIEGYARTIEDPTRSPDLKAHVTGRLERYAADLDEQASVMRQLGDPVTQARLGAGRVVAVARHAADTIKGFPIDDLRPTPPAGALPDAPFTVS